MGYPNASDNYVNSDACVDSNIQYFDLYANTSILIGNTIPPYGSILYLDSNLTIPTSGTGGRSIKITQAASPFNSVTATIDSNGQIISYTPACP